jgi:hypothetical protein
VPPSPSPAPAIAPSPSLAPAPSPTAAPSPAAPTASASLLSALPLSQSWRLLIEAVRAARKVGLVAVLEHAVPLEISAAGVVIAVPKAHAGMLQDRENRASLELCFERVLGKRAPLVIKDPSEVKLPPRSDASGLGGSEVLQSVADQKRELREKASSARLAQGRAHPAVRAAVDLLGGEIEDVKDLGEG